MKRLHVPVSVHDVARSVRFYSTLFAAEPTIVKADYAKWMLDDPRVNFAISTRGGETGLDHLGIQVETPEELREVHGRLQRADRPVLEERAAFDRFLPPVWNWRKCRTSWSTSRRPSPRSPCGRWLEQAHRVHMDGPLGASGDGREKPIRRDGLPGSVAKSSARETPRNFLPVSPSLSPVALHRALPLFCKYC